MSRSEWLSSLMHSAPVICSAMGLLISDSCFDINKGTVFRRPCFYAHLTSNAVFTGTRLTEYY